MKLLRRKRPPRRAVAAEEAASRPARREASTLRAVVAQMTEGVLVFNEVLTPVLANKAARSILGMGEALPSVIPLQEATSLARGALQAGTAGPVEVTAPSGRILRVRAVSVEDPLLVIVFLVDVTDESRLQAMRRQFVAHASHELKTPVASIQALAEALTQAARDDPETTERFAARMVEEGERLGGLLRDLLDLSRLEDPANISRALVDLSRLAHSEVQDAEPRARARSIEFSADITSGAKVAGDASQLTLMLRNLLDNAIRYTDADGRIDLTVHQVDGEVTVIVADTGRGIPLRDQARVFERFYRVDEGRTRAEGGTGLGLAIVKHVVDIHGGRVQVESQLGEGSTFTVSLPAAT